MVLTLIGMAVQASEKPISKDELKKIATIFSRAVDANDAEKLKEILHGDMLQYVRLNGQLIPFKGGDFIQMIADKKIGGKPRKLTFKNVEIIRNETAFVIMNAVSDEYDFMYHLSLAKQEDSWVIVNILVDINKPQ